MYVHILPSLLSVFSSEYEETAKADTFQPRLVLKNLAFKTAVVAHWGNGAVSDPSECDGQ